MNADPVGEGADDGPSVLIVDDDAELTELLVEYLDRHGLRATSAGNGRAGLVAALSGRYDLLLLDVMLPDLEGFEVLRQLRRQSTLPVIMLTARTTQADRVAGLDAGADDYLAKPFGSAELLARIRAVLRRSGWAERPAAAGESLVIGGIRLVPTAREAYQDGKAVPLTTVEYDILEYLARAAGRVVPRQELATAIYHRKLSAFDRSLDMHMSNLRKKLGASGALIRTVRSVGYLFRSGPTSPED
jgi:two-component system response regulator CpxR